MADFRDQLLRAGLVDKKTKQQADTAARRKRKKKKKKKKGQARRPEDQQREAYEKRLAAEAQENRRREAARAREREATELTNRIANLVGSAALREPRPGPRRFCFVNRQQRIQWVYVSATGAWKLESGQLAIVEHPGDADEPHAVVPAQIAARIAQLDPECVRFWNRDPAGAQPEQDPRGEI